MSSIPPFAAATAAALLILSAACGKEITQTAEDPPEAEASLEAGAGPQPPASNPTRDAALDLQRLPWAFTADPSVERYGPLTKYMQSATRGSWDVAAGPQGVRIRNTDGRGQNIYLLEDIAPGLPGYRLTLRLRLHSLDDDEAAAGIVLAAASRENMDIVALDGGGDVGFYKVEDNTLTGPTLLGLDGDYSGGDHLLQAIVINGAAHLFVDGQFAGLVENSRSIASSAAIGLFVKGSADVTIQSATLETLPRFDPKRAVPAGGPGPQPGRE